MLFEFRAMIFGDWNKCIFAPNFFNFAECQQSQYKNNLSNFLFEFTKTGLSHGDGVDGSKYVPEKGSLDLQNFQVELE